MADNDVLSQDEIDALLDEVDNTEEGGGGKSSAPEPGAVRSFDFTTQRSALGMRMTVLEHINDEFSRDLRDKTITMLRRKVHIGIEEIQMLEYSDLMSSVKNPSTIHIVRILPLRGVGLVIVDPALLFIMVENLFGGRSDDQPAEEKRELSSTEMRVSQLLFEIVTKNLELAWASILKIDIEEAGVETNPAAVGITGPGDIILVNTFVLNIEGARGDLKFCIPYAMLEPIRQQLENREISSKDEMDEKWSSALQENVSYATVEATCRIAEAELMLEDVLNLKVGDVISVDMPEQVKMYVEEIPAFEVKYGMSGEHYALRVNRKLRY